MSREQVMVVRAGGVGLLAAAAQLQRRHHGNGLGRADAGVAAELLHALAGQRIQVVAHALQHQHAHVHGRELGGARAQQNGNQLGIGEGGAALAHQLFAGPVVLGPALDAGGAGAGRVGGQ